MKKIIEKINPKNYSMPLQIFLILFITFLIFTDLEIVIFNNVEKKLESSENYLKYEYVVTDFNNEENYNYSNYLSFVNKNPYYLLLTDESYNLIDSSPTSSITIDGMNYEVSSLTNYSIGEQIYYLVSDGKLIVNSEAFENGIKSTITDVNYPTNINYLYINNSLTTNALNEIKQSTFTETENYNTTTFILDNNKIISYIFKCNNQNLVVLIPLSIQTSTSNTLSIYQFFLFVGMLVVFICLAWAFNYIYVRPIKEMTEVASEISKLNFAIYAYDSTNKDYKELSNSINELSNSLRDVIENLNYKNNEIIKYNKSLDEEYQFKKQLVATISHEIKTPLAVIQATVCGIIDGIFEQDEVDAELQNILKEINQTNDMLQEIVQLYKLESNKFELKYELIDVNYLLANTIDEFSKIAEKYHQTIEVELNNNIYVNADKSQLQRVFSNILLNAITYSPEGNKIIVKSTDNANYTAIEIMNFGVTIKEADLKKIFEPFYRVDQSRKRSEDHGNGLGLYLVKEVLEKHNFDYGMENIENGVRFYCILPKPEISSE